MRSVIDRSGSACKRRDPHPGAVSKRAPSTSPRAMRRVLDRSPFPLPLASIRQSCARSSKRANHSVPSWRPSQNPVSFPWNIQNSMERPTCLYRLKIIPPVSPSLLAVVAVSASQQPNAWRQPGVESPWSITIRRWPKQLQSRIVSAGGTALPPLDVTGFGTGCRVGRCGGSGIGTGRLSRQRGGYFSMGECRRYLRHRFRDHVSGTC